MFATQSQNNKDFKARATKVHNGKYTYDKSRYVYDTRKVIITCPKHGDFMQSPTEHIVKGRGCQKCAWEACRERNRHSLKTFIEKANLKHNNRFDYSLIKEYTGNKDYYNIICPTHGVFSQRGDKHLRGQNGCKRCNRRGITTEDFISRANIIHKNKYSYTKTVYTKTGNKVIITCPKHGDFMQVAHYHLSGNGCPLCGEEIQRKAYLHEPTILYLIYLKDYDVYKVGITLVRAGIKERFRQDKNLNYTIIKSVYFIDGKDAFKTEQQVLKKHRTKKKYNIFNGGNTEIINVKAGESYNEFMGSIDDIINHNAYLRDN